MGRVPLFSVISRSAYLIRYFPVTKLDSTRATLFSEARPLFDGGHPSDSKQLYR
jgi:hypothetical protein